MLSLDYLTRNFAAILAVWRQFEPDPELFFPPAWWQPDSVALLH